MLKCLLFALVSTGAIYVLSDYFFTLNREAWNDHFDTFDAPTLRSDRHDLDLVKRDFRGLYQYPAPTPRDDGSS